MSNLTATKLGEGIINNFQKYFNVFFPIIFKNTKIFVWLLLYRFCTPKFNHYLLN